MNKFSNQLIDAIAALYSGDAIKGDPTEIRITGHVVWLAQQAKKEQQRTERELTRDTVSNRLTDCRSRLLDAEATLNFLRNRENLNNLLEHDSPDVVVGAMIDQAWELVANASGDCEAMTEIYNEDLGAEIHNRAKDIVEAGWVPKEPMPSTTASKAGIAHGEDPHSERQVELTDIQAPAIDSGGLTAGQSAMKPTDNRLKELSDELQKAADTSAAVSKVIESFMIERTYQSCPDWVESDFLLGGLIQANGILGSHICHLAESISYAREQGGES